MAVSAVEQLQVMASKRQYKEAAAQLEVSNLSLHIVGCGVRKQTYCGSKGV